MRLYGSLQKYGPMRWDSYAPYWCDVLTTVYIFTRIINNL